jgi:hypothetical protein
MFKPFQSFKSLLGTAFIPFNDLNDWNKKRSLPRLNDSAK